MNSTQLAALVPENEDLNVGWYNRFAKHPYYGKLGDYMNNCNCLFNISFIQFFNHYFMNRIEFWCYANEPYKNERV